MARRRWVSLLGRPGRLALIGLALALALVVFLGFFIPSMVEKNLLDSRTEMFTQIANDLVDDGLIDVATASPTEIAEFDLHVRHQLIGVDVFRVVLWDQSGVALYSDAPELVGLSSPSDQITRALGGEPVVDVPSAAEGELESLPGVELVREYYVPITDETGKVLGVLEVYEDAASISSTLSSTRRVVWFSILFGLGVLLIFLLALSRASLGVLDRRRRQAERLVAEMGRAQESERERIIGTLHDEIGQPLYRVLYGIEGSRSRLDRDGPVAEELDQLSHLVRWIDGALRSELLMLHQGSIAESTRAPQDCRPGRRSCRAPSSVHRQAPRSWFPCPASRSARRRCDRASASFRDGGRTRPTHPLGCFCYRWPRRSPRCAV